jgi:hypothetical protein
MRSTTLLFAVTALVLFAGAAFAAPKPMDERMCHFVQGFCEPGTGIVGQAEGQNFQFHGEVVSGWDPGVPPIKKALYKIVRLNASAVETVLDRLWQMSPPEGTPPFTSPPPRCAAYYAFVKNTSGTPNELWCFNGSQIRLIWEMNDLRHGRLWERVEPGGNTAGILLFDAKVKSGKFWLNRVVERYFTCTKDSVSPVPGQAVEVVDFNRYLGPLDISSRKKENAAIALLRTLQIIPPYISNDLAILDLWDEGMQQLGHTAAAGPRSIMFFEGYWGGVVCTNEARPETCRSDGREIFAFPRSGKMSGGNSRWHYQEWDGARWITQDEPVDHGIGSVSGFLVENAPVKVTLPCQPPDS